MQMLFIIESFIYAGHDYGDYYNDILQNLFSQQK